MFRSQVALRAPPCFTTLIQKLLLSMDWTRTHRTQQPGRLRAGRIRPIAVVDRMSFLPRCSSAQSTSLPGPTHLYRRWKKVLKPGSRISHRHIRAWTFHCFLIDNNPIQPIQTWDLPTCCVLLESDRIYIIHLTGVNCRSCNGKLFGQGMMLLDALHKAGSMQ